MIVHLAGSPVENISHFSDAEIVYILSKVDPLYVIDDLAHFFAQFPDRAKNIGELSGKPYWYNAALLQSAQLRPELMGIFGLSWQEKIINFMKKRMKGNELSKILSSWWSENTRLVDNLHAQYLIELAAGSALPSYTVQPNSSGNNGSPSSETDILSQNISRTTGIDKQLTDEFLLALYVLTRDGKIDYKKYNPSIKRELISAKEAFRPENILDKLQSSGKIIMLIGGIAVSAYLYNTLTKKRRSE